MTSISTGHIIMTSTQPVGSSRPQRESNLGPTHQELSSLPTELPHPLSDDDNVNDDGGDDGDDGDDNDDIDYDDDNEYDDDNDTRLDKKPMVYINENLEMILGCMYYQDITLRTDTITDFTWSVRLSRRQGWVQTRLR